jgi:hypothetical protein
MIFERRAYTFRPGNIGAFWQAQQDWNTPEVYGVVLDHNLSYFSTLAGPTEQIIQLYRFQSLDHWRGCYDTYYTTQKPDYFALVRPMMLRQENGFFIAPPLPELAGHLAASQHTLPPAVAAAALQGVDDMVVVETALDLFPGGLPAYWAACQTHDIATHALDAPHRIGMLFTLVGRIHRIIQYRGYATLAAAQAHREALDNDPVWHAFTTDIRSWVSRSQTLPLRPAPWPRMRTLLGRGR